MKRIGILTLALSLFSFSVACLSPQPTRYETTDSQIEVQTAPPGTRRVKVALISFRNLTGRDFLVQPATAQLTSLMFRSGYFEVIEPALVESVIKSQDQVTPENLKILQEKFGAEYFLTGTLTNFEIRETSSGFCILFGLLGSQQTREYIVETGIDYRLVTTAEGRIVDADAVENRRTDVSRNAAILFSGGGYETRVLQSSGGVLLRYAMKDMVEKIIARLPPVS